MTRTWEMEAFSSITTVDEEMTSERMANVLAG